MEEEIDLKKQTLEKEIIRITNDINYLQAKNDETWEDYLDRILKVKKPVCQFESLVFIIIVTDRFNLKNKDKQSALTTLGFNRRS